MREAFSYFTSAVVHVIVLLLLSRAAFWLPGYCSSLPAGPSSIELVSSAPASPRATADPITEITPYDGATFDSLKLDDTSQAKVNRVQRELQLNVLELAALPMTPDGEIVLPAELTREFRRESSASHGPTASAEGATPPRRRPTPAEHEVVVEMYHTGSVASLASRAAAGANVDELPRPLANNPTPPYPPDALAANQHGRVILSVFVGSNGAVVNAKLVKSSGTRSLDEAALTTVQLWRFTPARRGGHEVAFEVLVPIRFEIQSG